MSSLYRSRPTWHSRTVVGNGMINTARPTLADRRPGVLLYLRLIGLPGRQTSGRPLGRQGVLTGETIQPAQTGMVLTAPRGPPRSARAANGWRLADSGLFVVRKPAPEHNLALTSAGWWRGYHPATVRFPPEPTMTSTHTWMGRCYKILICTCITLWHGIASGDR